MGATKLNNKPSFVELVFSIGLVWVISTLLDDIFPDLNLFIHIATVVLTSAVIWSAISNKVADLKRRAEIVKKYDAEIDDMLEQGMSIMEISNRIFELEHGHKPGEKPKNSVNRKDQELQSTKIVIKSVGAVCGTFNDEPIYETIELDNGAVYEFDGVANKSVNVNNLTKDSILFPNGFIYRPKISN